MRPIRITNKIKGSFESLIDSELLKPDSVLSIAKNKIIDLNNNINASLQERAALLEITTDFKKFILYSPTEQALFIAKCIGISPLLFYDPALGRIKTTPFGRNIITALNYDGFRPEYADKITLATGLKTCPYCNAALTIVTTRKNGQKKSLFQLDHFYPKARYPLFCISFFNLIPSCGNCNNSKRDNDVTLVEDFHLFADETHSEGYRFEIPKDNVARYLVSNDLNYITIDFVPGSDGNVKNTNHHDESFNIKGLYETQKDVIEELFWKAKAYPDERIEELSNLLKLPDSVIRRMVIGNYIDKEDIHKRPLSKFQQDIARQLGLIKK